MLRTKNGLQCQRWLEYGNGESVVYSFPLPNHLQDRTPHLPLVTGQCSRLFYKRLSSLLTIMSQPGRGSDLSDRRTFPAFDALADLGMLPFGLFSEFPATDWKNGRYENPEHNEHWCFLGEIEENTTLVRLAVTVRDRDGRGKFLVACHDDDRGMHLERLAKKGNTVAVLYPKVHGFADGQIGFRIEDSSQLTILPFSLKELEDSNNLFHHPTTKCSAKECEKEGDSRCSGCRLARYCSTEHQTAHWGQHKSPCKAIKAIEWFATKDWTKWDGKPFAFLSPSKKSDPVSLGEVLTMKGMPYGATMSMEMFTDT